MNPGSRSGHLLEIEHLGIQNQIQIHIAIVALNDFSLRLQSLHNLFQTIQFGARNFRCLVQQYNITELDLLNHQIFKVIFFNILTKQLVAACKLALHTQSIHHRHHTVQTRHSILGVRTTHRRNRADSLGNRIGFTDAAGLNDNVVKAFLTDNIGQLLHQVHFQRTANTTILQSHQTVVILADDTAFLNQVGIDIHLANIVDNHREFDTTTVCKNAVYQSCLSTAKIASQQQHRSLCIHSLQIFRSAKIQNYLDVYSH